MEEFSELRSERRLFRAMTSITVGLLVSFAHDLSPEPVRGPGTRTAEYIQNKARTTRVMHRLVRRQDSA